MKTLFERLWVKRYTRLTHRLRNKCKMWVYKQVLEYNKYVTKISAVLAKAEKYDKDTPKKITTIN